MLAILFLCSSSLFAVDQQTSIPCCGEMTLLCSTDPACAHWAYSMLCCFRHFLTRPHNHPHSFPHTAWGSTHQRQHRIHARAYCEDHFPPLSLPKPAVLKFLYPHRTLATLCTVPLRVLYLRRYSTVPAVPSRPEHFGLQYRGGHDLVPSLTVPPSV